MTPHHFKNKDFSPNFVPDDWDNLPGGIWEKKIENFFSRLVNKLKLRKNNK
jgi:hypothetical protein